MTLAKRLDADHRKRVLAAADELEQLLKPIPSPYPDRETYDREVSHLRETLTTRASARASLNVAWDGASISMLGFRASATSGLVAECRNWISQVRKKVRGSNKRAAAGR